MSSFPSVSARCFAPSSAAVASGLPRRAAPSCAWTRARSATPTTSRSPRCTSRSGRRRCGTRGSDDSAYVAVAPDPVHDPAGRRVGPGGRAGDAGVRPDARRPLRRRRHVGAGARPGVYRAGARRAGARRVPRHGLDSGRRRRQRDRGRHRPRRARLLGSERAAGLVARTGAAHRPLDERGRPVRQERHDRAAIPGRVLRRQPAPRHLLHRGVRPARRHGRVHAADLPLGLVAPDAAAGHRDAHDAHVRARSTSSSERSRWASCRRASTRCTWPC